MGTAACGGKGVKERARVPHDRDTVETLSAGANCTCCAEGPKASKSRQQPTQASCPPPPPNPDWTRRVHLDAPGQRHGQQPRLRDGRPPE